MVKLRRAARLIAVATEIPLNLKPPSTGPAAVNRLNNFRIFLDFWVVVGLIKFVNMISRLRKRIDVLSWRFLVSSKSKNIDCN